MALFPRRARRRAEAEDAEGEAQSHEVLEVDAALASIEDVEGELGVEVDELGTDEIPEEADEDEGEKRGRFAQRFSRARGLAGRLVSIRARRRVDDGTFDELEEALILADVGLSTTTTLLEKLRAGVKNRSIPADTDALIDALKSEILALFEGDSTALEYAAVSPTVWLVVGVNGVGKTTTIGKLAARERARGHNLVLAAGDTFRAAAGEQLELWAERAQVELIAGAEGADPSSVVFDAISHATARHADLVIADTAGRLHTKVNLMDELKKIRRVADRPPAEVTEVLLVLDATTGQNGLIQAREFLAAVGVTGVVLTKLDGTAKGGIVCAIRSELGVPIKLVGLGEGLDDLVEFDAEQFADALVG